MKKLKQIKYLFLDDVRDPYLTDQELEKVRPGTMHMASAYYYTNYEPFKTEKWEVVRDYYQFVDWITLNGAENLFVAFDHDLADEHYDYELDVNTYTEKTGYDAAKWLCEYCQDKHIKFPKYIIHSMNLVGTENIHKYIENYKKYIENN